MLSLSPDHHSKLYECTTAALNGAWDKSIHDSVGAAENLPDLLVAVIAAVQSAVNEACADFKQQWNDLNTDPIMRLPVELIGQCFQPLRRLRDRITVSHVSRAWRRVAVNERSLWTEAILTGKVRHPATKLSDMLSRSHPLPFHLSWQYTQDDGSNRAILDIISQNMNRFNYVCINDMPCSALGAIFARPASLLQELVIINDWLDFCDLPARWSAPLLQSLVLDVFALPPDFEPLPSLRSFRGRLPAGSQSRGPDDIGLPNLFLLFPGLTSLFLYDVTDEAIALLGDVPPSVVEIVLMGTEERAVDVSPFVLHRMGDTVRQLTTHAANNITRTIDAFATRAPGTWSMTVSERNTVTLQADDNDIVYELQNNSRSWYRWDLYPFMRHLERLSTLTLPLRVLVEFVDEEATWDRRLPSLRAFYITAHLSSDVHAARERVLSALPSTPPIHAARLDDISLSIYEPRDVLAFEAVIPTLLSPDCLHQAKLCIDVRSGDVPATGT